MRTFKDVMPSPIHFDMIAIDPSKTRTGFAMFQEGILFGHSNASCKNDLNYETLIAELKYTVLPSIDKNSVVVIEAPYNDKNIKSFGIQCEVIGVIKGMVGATGARIVMIPAATWYQRYGGAQDERSERKASTKDYVETEYGLFANEDICDAIAIGDYYHEHMDDW